MPASPVWFCHGNGMSFELLKQIIPGPEKGRRGRGSREKVLSPPGPHLPRPVPPPPPDPRGPERATVTSRRRASAGGLGRQPRPAVGVPLRPPVLSTEAWATSPGLQKRDRAPASVCLHCWPLGRRGQRAFRGQWPRLPGASEPDHAAGNTPSEGAVSSAHRPPLTPAFVSSRQARALGKGSINAFLGTKGT